MKSGEPGFIQIEFTLNIKGHKLRQKTTKAIKILFSGHQGSGKSLELKRINEFLNEPARYFSIYIEIEQEIEYNLFRAEDMFVLLLTKLVERIEEEKLDFNYSVLETISSDWLKDKEILRELTDNYQFEGSSEASVGASFWKFLSLKGKLKALFSHNSKTARIIREKIQRNSMELIERLNIVLIELRETLEAQSKGRDVLFILDGTEKIKYEIYTQLFVNDSHLIRAINTNMIFAVPINAFYDIRTSATGVCSVILIHCPCSISARRISQK